MKSKQYPINISSEGGNIFNIKWYNSMPSISLTYFAFESPCGCYSIAKAYRQYGFASYWVRFNFDSIKIKTNMILSGIVWTHRETLQSSAIICRNKGEIMITGNISTVEQTVKIEK